jgi:hypothetical protein
VTAPVGRIRVEGGPRLRATLKAAGQQLQDLTALHKRVAEVVADRARGTAPVGPPPTHVRDTVRAAGTKAAAIVRAGKARVPYAMPLHWGHKTPTGRLVKAQPWIAQAAQDTAPAWTHLYETELQKITDSVEGTTTPL